MKPTDESEEKEIKMGVGEQCRQVENWSNLVIITCFSVLSVILKAFAMERNRRYFACMFVLSTAKYEIILGCVSVQSLQDQIFTVKVLDLHEITSLFSDSSINVLVEVFTYIPLTPVFDYR